MPAREHFLARLLELPRIQDQDVRRGVFRQAVAGLGQVDAAAGPLSLAGVDPHALARSVQMLWADGTLDDLDFIAPAAAAVALYQIGGALPLGNERHEVGRKVLRYLYQGNAETFAELASRMALGSTKPLSGAGIRARVSLCTELRASADAAIDRMALAFVTRRELAREWVSLPAMGSLPERRLAARLLERAAREAARRATAGDRYALRIFQAVHNPARYLTPPRPDASGTIGPAWISLLADRETLVWRHVAVARGLLCSAIPELVDQLRGQLRNELSPTEWRRASTSLVTRIACDREAGLRDAIKLLDSPLLKRDPGIAMAMVWGLPPVADVEPEAAEAMADVLAAHSPIVVADALAELRSEVQGFGAQAAETCAHTLRASLTRTDRDDGLTALGHGILAELEGDGIGTELAAAVRAALDAFGEQGTREAFGLARDALAAAATQVGRLEALELRFDDDDAARMSRARSLILLRDLDAHALALRALNDLLLLGRAPGSSATGVEAIDDLDARIAHWLLDPKHTAATAGQIDAHATIHQRQLRALLHLIDGSNTDFGEDSDRRTRVRGRWTQAVRLFTAQLADLPGTRLTRAIIATIARACDALVRDGAAEPVDVFLYAATHLSSPNHLTIVAEASMHPDVTQLVLAYLDFVRINGAQANELHKTALGVFKEFLDRFPSQRTSRSEAFRVTAWTLVRALESMLEASSLGALLPQESAGASPLAVLEDAVAQLHQLVVGAERRCSDHVAKQQTALARRHALATAADGAVNAGGRDLAAAIAATIASAAQSLPAPIAQLVSHVLPRLAALPITDEGARPPAAEPPPILPDWVPPRRIVGGFYLVKPLGGGNVGSVFIVTRAEDRHDPNADRFALKVPEYNATVARSIGEAEFLKLFREEAGALLAMPEHPNIAGFVTFDAGAKPKPILVMELVDGVSCERVIGSRSFDTTHALDVLDGVMAGLEAMHQAGISHLDVKPSNAILREGSGQPVLVDFGLAGRHIRPGCATLCYGAPEVWETLPGAVATSHAWAADVYAFGCLSFEVLTAHTLFEGNSDVAIISAHITHDGLPPPVHRMSLSPALQPLSMFLHQCLRHRPEHRARVSDLRRELGKLRPMLERRPWPLSLD